MSTTQKPTLASVLNSATSSRLKGVRVSLPARVESYNEAKRTISAQPLVHDGYIDETGKRQVSRLPVVTNVPVVFPGSGGARFRFPITKGDTVLLLFSSSSLEQFLQRGGEVDPKTDHRHSLTDAIAIPGLQPPAGAAIDGASDADTMIEITVGGEIHAGGSDALALKSELDDLRSYVAKQFDALTGHVHAVSGAATTGITSATGPGEAPTDPPPTVTGTTKLKGS